MCKAKSRNPNKAGLKQKPKTRTEPPGPKEKRGQQASVGENGAEPGTDQSAVLRTKD